MSTGREFALQVTRRLQSAGFQALWAGGCVRDQLLGRQPKDYDVATDATPDQIRTLFGHRQTLAIGAAFGVITVIGPAGVGNIEVATFRRDANYSDGRRPDSVQFSDAETDAQRRDFTINGLFFDPVQETVVDFVHGRRDLGLRLIRAIGDPEERIAEDKLRMLRAVRFASILQFELDPATLSAIRKHSDEIGAVSAERIAGELQRMLLDENRATAVGLLVETCLMDWILPEAKPITADPIRLAARLDELQRIGSVDSMAVALFVLLHDEIDSVSFGQLCTRLKQPNVVRKHGCWMVEHAETLMKADRLAWSTIQPLLTQPMVHDALACIDAICPGETAVPWIRQRLRETETLDPPPLLDGLALKRAGIPSGPLYKKILAEVRRAQLDGQITTRSQALQLAQSIVHD